MVVKIGFIANCFSVSGGTEVWHKTLIQRLRNVVGFAAYESLPANGDLSQLACSFRGIGLGVCQELVLHCDVLIVWGLGWRLKKCLAKRRTKPKIISVSHSDMRSDWTIRMMQEQSLLADHNVCVYPTGYGTMPRDRPWSCIPNAPDVSRIGTKLSKCDVLEKYGLVPHQKYLLCLGRITEDKNQSLLVSTISHLPEEYQLLVVGRSHEEAYTRSLLASRVKVLPPTDNPGELLSVVHALVSASSFEGYGYSMAEAMLAKVPVIATPVGIVELDLALATVVPLGSIPERWAEAIVHPKDTVDYAFNKMSEYTVDDMAQKWQELIDAVAT